MSQLDAITIPDKTYFKIGEVAKLLDLEPYVTAVSGSISVKISS
jgi:hypothetical protein